MGQIPFIIALLAAVALVTAKLEASLQDDNDADLTTDEGVNFNLNWLWLKVFLNISMLTSRDLSIFTDKEFLVFPCSILQICVFCLYNKHLIITVNLLKMQT